MSTIEMHQRAPCVHVGERVRPDPPRPVLWPDIPCAPSDVYDLDEDGATGSRGPDARDTGREPVPAARRR